MDEPAIEGEVRILHENPWDRCDGDGRNGSVFSWRGGPISFLRDAVKHISDDVPDYGKSAEATVHGEEQFCVHGTDFRTPGRPSKRMAWVFGPADVRWRMSDHWAVTHVLHNRYLESIGCSDLLSMYGRYTSSR